MTLHNRLFYNSFFRDSLCRPKARPSKTRCALSLGLGALCSALALHSAALTTEAYHWQNVRIDGGGFVPGIIFNQTESDLIYARTDIGGAYRWNPADHAWVPLLDWVGWNNWGWNGVLSMATDPVDTNRVYAAVGMYTNSWDPNNGAILRSTDKGQTWQAAPLPFKVGGNMPGRGQGERLAIDPNKNNILYFGAEGGNGLWRSTDYGATWAKVNSFTNAGTYAADPTDPSGYLSQLQGVTWVTFDPSSGTAGSASQIIYAGVADKANPLYRSTDGGDTWAPIPGAPAGYLAHKGVYDAQNDLLYIATSDTGGPYDGSKGQVWKFNANTNTWTDISPLPLASNDLYFGFSGLTIDRQNPGTLMVASQVAWWPDAVFFRTTNGGASWTRIWDWAGYPSRSLRYEMDITQVPWLNFGITNPVAPELAVKLGWMNESVEIDPHNSNRLMYGTGATIYGTDNLTNWDSGANILIKPMVKGLEETAVLDVISPPSGAPVFSALGDIGGFRHDSLTQVPGSMFIPTMTSTTSIDFAELAPATLVRVGNVDSGGAIALSTSGGASWWAGQNPPGVTGGGNVAMAADGSAIVWAPGGSTSVFVSTTLGSSWSPATGLPAGAIVEADRANANKFYALANGTFYVSTNKGASFSATAASNIPAAARKFKAVYGREGDIWLAGGSATTTYGLWRSSNSGVSFTRVANVQEADNVTFGKAAPGANYPTVYIIGKVEGVRGVFRSTDQGTSWVRINDDQHQYGNFGDAISGDPRIYGRLYLGTNGRGLLYGDAAGAGSSSSSTPSSSSAPSSSSMPSSSSSAPSSASSSISSAAPSSSSSSSSSSVVGGLQCNWYGTRYPLCVTTPSGWGWENQQSCIAASTCSAQPAPYGIVGGSSSATSSPVSSASSSSFSSTSSSAVSSSASSASVPSSSSSLASSAPSSASSSSQGGSNVSASVTINNEWNSGYCAGVTLTNNSTSPVTWTVTLSISGTLSNIWGATASQSGSSLTISGLAWNAVLQPGETNSSVGFCANK